MPIEKNGHYWVAPDVTGPQTAYLANQTVVTPVTPLMQSDIIRFENLIRQTRCEKYCTWQVAKQAIIEDCESHDSIIAYFRDLSSK